MSVIVGSKVIESLARPSSIYTYAIIPHRNNPVVAGTIHADSSLYQPRYGFDLQARAQDPAQALFERRYLLLIMAIVLTLLLGAAVFASWFPAACCCRLIG